MKVKTKKYLYNVLILFIGLLLISCNQDKKENTEVVENSVKETEAPENFDWLLGNWKRNNEEEGKETFENWEKKSRTEYIGLGFTMQGSDTTKQESIRLVKSNKSWRLEVKAPEDSEAISFKMTSFNEQEFICENEELDFPKLIKYWKNGNKLNALVSGGDMKIEFEFKKLKNMKLGAFSVSLNVKDLKASKIFYENLGFTVFGGSMEMNYLIMKNENSLIGLFHGMFENNILTFNPGWDVNAKELESYDDVREIQKQLKNKGLKLESEANENTSGPASIVIKDPDGNVIFIDQHI